MNLSESTTDKSGKLVKVSSKNKIFTSRTMRMANFSLEKASELALKNILDLSEILKWNLNHNIKFFRISSNMFPFIDHPKLHYKIDDLPDGKKIMRHLRACGDFARLHDMRLTCHPGPYTCIASPNESTRNKSLMALTKHAEIAEHLNTHDFVINIHVGGNYDKDYERTAQAFIEAFNTLDAYTRNRITLENDDKPNMWSVQNLYDYIYKATNIPIVFDIHHWKFNHKLSMEDAAKLALSTWGYKVPIMHYSESRPDAKPQAHSDYLSCKIPDFDGEYDVMLETKQKDKALIKYKEM